MRRARTLDQLTREMDRLYDSFGLGREWLGSRGGRPRPRGGPGDIWMPEVEVLQRNRELVIRVDLPGLNKDDVTVEVTDEAVIIQGERKWAHEEERAGVYRSERSYGSFSRVVPLPDGAVAEQAKATFKSGVLEVTMPGPPRSATTGRPIPIEEPT